MAQATANSAPVELPTVAEKVVGRSQDGVAITDATEQVTPRDQFMLRVTAYFENDHREPKRFYRFGYTEQGWRCRTPEMPAICEDLLEWLNETATDAGSLSN